MRIKVIQHGVQSATCFARKCDHPSDRQFETSYTVFKDSRGEYVDPLSATVRRSLLSGCGHTFILSDEWEFRELTLHEHIFLGYCIRRINRTYNKKLDEAT